MPAASWTDALQRADDDAHTLTLAAQVAASDWHGVLPLADAGETLRTQVAGGEVVALTITF